MLFHTVDTRAGLHTQTNQLQTFHIKISTLSSFQLTVGSHIKIVSSFRICWIMFLERYMQDNIHCLKSGRLLSLGVYLMCVKIMHAIYITPFFPRFIQLTLTFGLYTGALSWPFMSCNVSQRITLLEVQDETCTVFEPSLLTQIRIIDPSLVHFTLQFHCKDKGGMRAVKYFCENILHRQHPKLVQDVVDVPFSVVCNFNFPSFSSISFIEHKIEFSQWMRGPKGWPIATLPTCSYKVGH